MSIQEQNMLIIWSSTPKDYDVAIQLRLCIRNKTKCFSNVDMDIWFCNDYIHIYTSVIPTLFWIDKEYVEENYAHKFFKPDSEHSRVSKIWNFDKTIEEV